MNTFNEYQETTAKYRLNTYTPEACVMGFLSEAGEVAGVFQKMIRGDYPPDEAMTKLYKELGDCLYHLSEICTDNGWSLAEVATENISKLESRKIRGVILGSGDER